MDEAEIVHSLEQEIRDLERKLGFKREQLKLIKFKTNLKMDHNHNHNHKTSPDQVTGSGTVTVTKKKKKKSKKSKRKRYYDTDHDVSVANVSEERYDVDPNYVEKQNSNYQKALEVVDKQIRRMVNNRNKVVEVVDLTDSDEDEKESEVVVRGILDSIIEGLAVVKIKQEKEEDEEILEVTSHSAQAASTSTSEETGQQQEEGAGQVNPQSWLKVEERHSRPWLVDQSRHSRLDDAELIAFLSKERQASEDEKRRRHAEETRSTSTTSTIIDHEEDHMRWHNYRRGRKKSSSDHESSSNFWDMMKERSRMRSEMREDRSEGGEWAKERKKRERQKIVWDLDDSSANFKPKKKYGGVGYPREEASGVRQFAQPHKRYRTESEEKRLL